MSRRYIFSGSKFEDMAGYCRALVDGEWIHVSGTLGCDPKSGSFPEGAFAQTEQALKVIEKALQEAGARFSDVYRCRIYITDENDLEDVCRALHAVFGDVRPTMTAVICRLVAPEGKVEIEVSARNSGN